MAIVSNNKVMRASVMDYQSSIQPCHHWLLLTHDTEKLHSKSCCYKYLSILKLFAWSLNEWIKFDFIYSSFQLYLNLNFIGKQRIPPCPPILPFYVKSLGGFILSALDPITYTLNQVRTNKSLVPGIFNHLCISCFAWFSTNSCGSTSLTSCISRASSEEKTIPRERTSSAFRYPTVLSTVSSTLKYPIYICHKTI